MVKHWRKIDGFMMGLGYMFIILALVFAEIATVLIVFGLVFFFPGAMAYSYDEILHRLGLMEKFTREYHGLTKTTRKKEELKG